MAGFLGAIRDGKVHPIPPQQAYEITRRALRVRNDLVAELLQPKLSSKDLQQILGQERAKLDADQWSEQETAKVKKLQDEQGRALFNEKVSAALEAVQKELQVETAVYVSSGVIYARDDKPDSLKVVQLDDPSATGMVRWPIAHNVRPAGWALGVGGCLECHSDHGKIFTSTVAPLGPGPDRGNPVTMASLQGIQPDQSLAWNELFRGRKSFKFIVAGSITILLMTLMIGVGAVASRFAAGKQSAT